MTGFNPYLTPAPPSYGGSISSANSVANQSGPYVPSGYYQNPYNGQPTGDSSSGASSIWGAGLSALPLAVGGPPAWVGAAIGGAATLGSGLIGKHAQKQALEAQNKATLEQLAYAQKIEDERRREWAASENANRQMSNYRTAVNDQRGRMADSVVKANIGRVGGTFVPRPTAVYLPEVEATSGDSGRVSSQNPGVQISTLVNRYGSDPRDLASLSESPYANRFGNQYNYIPPPQDEETLSLGSALSDWSRAIMERKLNG